MKTIKTIEAFREPYSRGPHVRYFISALGVAFSIVVMLVVIFIAIMRLFF